MVKVVVKRYGEEKPLATEIIKLLKNKEVTYKEAIEALEDASSYLKRASLQNKI